jgi:hypothetical protein
MADPAPWEIYRPCIHRDVEGTRGWFNRPSNRPVKTTIARFAAARDPEFSSRHDCEACVIYTCGDQDDRVTSLSGQIKLLMLTPEGKVLPCHPH